jgi:DNA-binding protein HU-beta
MQAAAFSFLTYPPHQVIGPVLPISGLAVSSSRTRGATEPVMNTKEIVRHLALKIGKTQLETRKLLAACIAELRQTLEEGRSFTIPGLGTFQLSTRKARVAYSPRHKQKMLFPPKRVVTFRPGAALKRLVNEPGGSHES